MQYLTSSWTCPYSRDLLSCRGFSGALCMLLMSNFLFMLKQLQLVLECLPDAPQISLPRTACMHQLQKELPQHSTGLERVQESQNPLTFATRNMAAHSNGPMPIHVKISSGAAI